MGALPWGHIIELLRLKDPAVRDWYAQQTLEKNWKLQVLEHQITCIVPASRPTPRPPTRSRYPCDRRWRSSVSRS
ncbi:DUF1016 N-terminal domain-containing protein [Arthrobacter sp. NPDC080031]|uniref:DUF1016 N-terminal domain-containing protein n=1 Tax=Arthrobacter sp. NPDC080031 TaxID=3155918 RepID=UPI00344F0E83